MPAFDRLEFKSQRGAILLQLLQQLLLNSLDGHVLGGGQAISRGVAKAAAPQPFARGVGNKSLRCRAVILPICVVLATHATVIDRKRNLPVANGFLIRHAFDFRRQIRVIGQGWWLIEIGLPRG